MTTSARMEVAPDILFYAPHRFQKTGVSSPSGLLRWDWQRNFFQPSAPQAPPVSFGLSEKELFVVLDGVCRVIAARISTLHGGALAAMYREFEADDRELAESGLAEYGR